MKGAVWYLAMRPPYTMMGQYLLFSRMAADLAVRSASEKASLYSDLLPRDAKIVRI